MADKPGWAFSNADDIVNNKLLLHADANKVKQILGEPTSRHNSTMKRTNWDYDMGVGGGGLVFLFHYLTVRFDDGRVVGVEYSTIRD